MIRALVAAAVLGMAGPLAAQSMTVQGHVARSTVDGERPLARALVTLHRVTPTGGAPVDSVLTSPGGEYRFRVAAPDTGAMYLATSRFGGIAYFAPPVRANEPVSDGEIHVFDTTSAPVRISVAGRHIVVAAPTPDGYRMVTEVWELSNDTVLTRISRPGSPAFEVALPDGARDPRSVQGDFSGSATAIGEGRAAIVAPMAPGLRQLVLTYDLPPAAFPWHVTLTDSSDVVEVLVEEATGQVSGGGLQAMGAVPAEGRNFLRFLGRDLPRGTRVQIAVPPPAGRGGTLWWVGGLGLASLGAVGWALRRRSPGVPPAAAPTFAGSAAELRAAIAGVENQLAAPETAPAARPSLEAYRAELRSQLSRLAPGSDLE